MQATLGPSVRLVTLQFSFSNPDLVPDCVKQLPHETIDEAAARKIFPTPGQPLIQPTENVSLAETISMLEQNGYELVDAFYKPRIDKNNRTYHAVRFVFAHRQYVELSPQFRQVRSKILEKLNEICSRAMWRVRSFLNPFFKEGEKVEGQHALSLNLEARKPLVQPNGQPVVVWQRDAQGEKIGTAPIPLKAKLALVVVNHVVQIKEVSPVGRQDSVRPARDAR